MPGVFLKEQYGALLRAGRVFIPDLKKKDGYEANYLRLVSYFKEHNRDFVSALSMHTRHYLRDCLQHKNQELPEQLIFNEDFLFLLELGVLTPKKMVIAKEYIPIVRQALKYEYIDHTTFGNTVLKGLIDLFGYVEISVLKKHFSRLTKIHFTNKDVYECCNECSLIRYHCKIRKSFVTREEIYPIRNDVLQFRNENCQEDYPTFFMEDVLDFANSFALQGSSPFFNKNDIVLNITRLLSINLYVEPELLDSFYHGDEEKINIFNEYNENYPKWLYKGHNIRYMQFVKNESEYDERIYA